MRLIGGHDYYDGAGMGVDTSVVFVRDPARHLADLPLRTDHPFRVPERSVYGDGAERTELIPTLILIGGERIPALEERVTEAWVMSSRFHYELAEAEAAILRARARHPSRWGGFLRRRSFLEEVRAHFAGRLTQEETGWLISNHVTVLSTWLPPHWREKTVPAQVNHARLTELELFRKLDPATAHMRIASFLSGVLPFSRPTVELPDRDRIRKAGFDLRSSFRKPKQG
ncbi:hypothetical protein IQ03_01095 [Gemmobacter caeni]|uniref:Uncharacterized protein n=1 Tax=Gemmobacter caeni TaxID=589035 RepID=A0A2T6B8B4_9RHOB|nr:hypothetical protein [Gemmobacter caeni]PTX52305.1 hypothetical protein C8N34_10283 [Gemmobacter caeni]TWJ02678.1 hypothetical protein IQ03_01095 [Gemmobacter caeni]